MAMTLLQFAAQTPNMKTKGLVERVTNTSIFLKILNFIMITTGLTYEYPRRETLPGAQTRALGGSYTTTSGLIIPQTETCAIVGGQVDTDNVYIAQNPDARANEIAGTIQNSGLQFDYLVLKGNPAVDPTQFYGLESRLAGNQLLVAGTNGAALTLDMMDQLLDEVVGGEQDKILVMCKADRRALTKLVRAAAHTVTYEATTGQVSSYNGVPIYVLDEDGQQNPILTKNETCGSSNVTSSIFCMKIGGATDRQYMQGLLGNGKINHYPVGVLGTYFRDVVEMYGGICLFHPRAAARLSGLL